MCHPYAPSGGGGCGSFVLPGPIDSCTYDLFSSLPHPFSPAAQYLLIEQPEPTNSSNTSANLENEPYPKWGIADAAIWKLWPEAKGGGNVYLFRYKDGWIAHNKSAIKKAAAENQIPVDLLAGVAWAEVGGMPDIADSIAFPVRSFDWSGPDWVDKNMTLTKDPHQTSVGSVSIQLSNGAAIMGLDLNKLSYTDKTGLIKTMENDVSNLDMVSKFLYKLIKHDFPNANTSSLTDTQLIVTASRYNRGTARKLSDFIDSINAPETNTKLRAYTSYGRALLRHKERIKKLLT